jgi:hypothetical protein
VDELHESLEEAVYERDELRLAISQHGNREKELKRKVELQKRELKSFKESNHQHLIKC